MTVYVESNFVLEHALQQEEYDSCEKILSLAASADISLAIPAFALAEPHQALTAKKKSRERLASEIRAHATELGRSDHYRGVVENLRRLAPVLVRSIEEEQIALRHTVASLLAVAAVIPLNHAVLKNAANFTKETKLSDQDNIVLASVLMHLEETRPAASCFLNRNANDFKDPSILRRLGEFGCKYFSHFHSGLNFIRAQLRGPKA